MCQAVRCKACNKITWSGCGMHVASVRAQVPAGQWCGGHDAPESGGGFLSRLLRK
jgi:hypothetical protein